MSKNSAVELIDLPVCSFINPASVAESINRWSQVAGRQGCGIALFERAFIWSPDSAVIILSPVGTIESLRLTDISDNSAAVGNMRVEIDKDTFEDRSFVYVDAAQIELRPLPGSVFSFAYGVNGSTDAVGAWGHQSDSGIPRACVWRGGTMTDLSQHLPAGVAYAHDISDSDGIAGYVGARAFRIWDTTTEILPNLPDAFAGHAFAINNAGHVCGQNLISKGPGSPILVRAVLWRHGTIVDLGTLPGFDRSRALDLNDADLVIGECFSSTHSGRVPILWRAGVMYDLNTIIDSVPPGQFVTVHAVNRHGQIACEIDSIDGATYAAILHPVPPRLGDVTCDERVDVSDLLVLLTAWGACHRCLSDLDGDGVVAAHDLLLLVTNWS